MPDIALGSRVRKSPYYDSTVAAGVQSFTIYNHMYMPIGYGNPAAEYQRLTEGVALWDVAGERQVEVSGPDAFALANAVSARDLTGMAIGRARYAPLCDHDGRLINDPVILRVGEDRFWFSLADSDILHWVRAIAAERSFDANVFEPDVSPLAIQGPKALDVARDLFGADVVDSLGFFHHRSVELDSIPMVICRSGWSKQGGVELFLTNGSRGNQLWDRVMAAGEPYGIGPGGPNQQERIESGLLSYGTDHDGDTDPVEAGLGQYVSLDGIHDFVGRTGLEARLMRTVRRNVVNVRLARDVTDVIGSENPWPAFIDDEPVGQVRTAVWSTKFETWLGLAQLATPHDAAGTTFEVTLPSGESCQATVHDEPFGAIQTHG